MLNSLTALLLIALSFVPSSNIRTNLETRLKNNLAPQEKSAAVIKEGSEITLTKVPEKSALYTEMTSGSNAALFSDYSSGEILFSKNKDKKLQIASTTKLMTALVAIEKTKPNDVITVPAFTVKPLDTTMGLSAGDKLKVSELLHGLLIESGADAAETLAIRIGGSEQGFAALMNERAAKLGLTNTQFTNPVGHDSSGNYSTASDLVKLARVAVTNPQVAEIVAKPSYTATSETGKKYYLVNTNKLLGGAGYKGIKTGTTFDAGQCLITLYNDGERDIIGVVLASPDRFSETRNIIEWTKRSYTW